MSDGISYQNMDIEFKILSEHFKEKSFKAYGLDLPKIKTVLPTNLPVIKADEKRIDNLFLLEDDTLAIVDYESTDKLTNRIKYVNYIARVMEKYYKDEKQLPDLRMIVIYTGDVENAKDKLETSCFCLNLEQVFLKNLDGEVIYQSIRNNIENSIPLSDEELMQLIILPLTEKGKDKKQERIENVVNLAKQITKDADQAFVVAGVIVSSDQFIDKEYANQVRRWLSMTKVGRIFEEERLESMRQTEHETKIKIGKNLLADNMDIVDIMKYTGLSRKEIEDLMEESLHVTP